MFDVMFLFRQGGGNEFTVQFTLSSWSARFYLSSLREHYYFPQYYSSNIIVFSLDCVSISSYAIFLPEAFDGGDLLLGERCRRELRVAFPFSEKADKAERENGRAMA